MNELTDLQIREIKDKPGLIRYAVGAPDDLWRYCLLVNSSLIRYYDGENLVGMQYSAVNSNPNNIIYIENPSDDLIKLAVSKNPDMIFAIPVERRTADIARSAVAEDPAIIKYLDDDVKRELAYVAIEKNPSTIRFLKSVLTEDMVTTALRKEPCVVRYLDEITEEQALIVAEAPYKEVYRSSFDISTGQTEIYKHHLFRIIPIDEMSDSVLSSVLYNNHWAAKGYIKTSEQALRATKMSGSAAMVFDNDIVTDEIIEVLIEKDPSVIARKFPEFITDDIRSRMVKNDPSVIRYFKDLKDSEVIFAISKDESHIKLVHTMKPSYIKHLYDEKWIEYAESKLPKTESTKPVVTKKWGLF